MKTEPRPKAEIVVRNYGFDDLAIYTSTRRALMWIEKNACTFGNLVDMDGFMVLNLNLCYDKDEVAEYIRSMGMGQLSETNKKSAKTL